MGILTTHKNPLSTLSIGGATYDLFLTLQDDLSSKENVIRLNIGGKLDVNNVIEACGGGASNTSVGLSRLGFSASFCGVVGSDQWGEKLLHTLQQEHVSVSSATIVEGETSSFSLVLSLPNGERTILYHAGVNGHLHDTTFDLDALSRVDAVYLNHLCKASCVIEDTIVEAIIEHPTLVLAWNPGGSQIDAGMDAKETARLLRATDLLLLNKEEACAFTRSNTLDMALKKLIDAGARNVCITDGKHGTHGSDGLNIYHCPALRAISIVDTTGAGDAFGAGALWAMLRGHSLQNMMISGTLNAASVCTSFGAQAGLLTENQIVERLDEHLLEVSTIS